MELYTLDPLNRRQYIIDQFESLIWTERWQAYGDFQLNIFSNYQTRSLLKPDTWLAMNKSNYVMRIESVEDDFNDDGSRILIIKGRDISAILGDRALVGVWTNAPADNARGMFEGVCVAGTWDVGDIITGINTGASFLPASTIPEPVDHVTQTINTITTLFDGIVTQTCITYDIGYRMIRQDSTGQIYFEIFAGSDRTTDQTTLPPVVFASQLDNLQNTKELTTIDTAKNVAVVRCPTETQIVYASEVDPTIDSFERRVLPVDASDITTDAYTDVTAACIQRGLQALAAARTNFLFDGEVSEQSQYVYGVDYNLGDLIEQQNTDGVQTDMRVTEQIFSEDNTGESYYPTLVSFVSINSGTWLGWNNNKAWFDLASDPTTWSEEP